MFLDLVCIGLHHLLNSNPGLLNHDGEQSDYSCRKDTGTAKKLRRWSRGHQFIVRAGGHIEAWQPLYKYASIILTVYISQFYGI